MSIVIGSKVPITMTLTWIIIKHKIQRRSRENRIELNESELNLKEILI